MGPAAVVPAKLAPQLRIAISGVLLMSMITVLVLNKLAIIWLLHSTSSGRIEAWFAAGGIVILVPEVVSLLVALWHTSFIKQTSRHQWPSPASLAGLAACLAEKTSLLILLLEVAPHIPVQVFIPSLAAVYAITLSHQQWEVFKMQNSLSKEMKYDLNFTLTQRDSLPCDEQQSTRSWKRIVLTIFGFSGIWASCAVSAILALSQHLPWFSALSFPACVSLLSLCWHPRVQLYTLRSSGGSYGARWKALCVYSFSKILISVLGLTVLVGFHFRVDSAFDHTFHEKLYNGFLLLLNKTYLAPVVLHLLSSLASVILAYTAAALCLTEIGISVPSFAATPITVALALYYCTTDSEWSMTNSCSLAGFGVSCACVLSIVIWLSPYIIHRFSLCRRSKVYMKPVEELFIQPSWNGLFLEQYMVLSYKHDGMGGSDHSVIDRTFGRKPRIFICTTMYREADFEMARLLVSISKLAKSKSLKKVYMESHIFLDNGTKGLHLTDFGCQLVSLLDNKLNIKPEEVSAYITPYGIQLQWDFGMPFFIHLKDPLKVKAKKRWSQVMYMTYILNFRMLKTANKVSPRSQTVSEPTIDPSIFVGYASDKEWSRNLVSLNQGTFHSLNHDSPPADRRNDIRKLAMEKTTQMNSSLESEYQQNISSDQGIGHSDAVSVSTGRNDDSSSEKEISSSFVHDSNYEGDISSVNDTINKREHLRKTQNSFEDVSDVSCKSWKQVKGEPQIEVDSFNDDDTYILATDADMEFTSESVESLLDVCRVDHRLGGVCGRTHPVGQKSGPLIWYQMFEYAKDFWMIKSAQNVIGSVMCCPGCFSLYRVSALRDVMQTYAGPTSQPFDVFIKDTGEDRWLCTLMMLHGWKLEYTAFCHNTTFCPTNLQEFLTQRRRWVLSDVANMLLVLKYIWILARKNDSFSMTYILYLIQMFAIVLLSPASTIVIMAGGLEIIYGLPFQVMAPLFGVMTLSYVITCLVCTMKNQVRLTFVLALVLGLCMVMIIVGGAVYIYNDIREDFTSGDLSFKEYHLILFLIAALLFAAAIHPTEIWNLGHGVSYFLGFPAMQILLPFYAACNIVDQSWGTRDGNTAGRSYGSCSVIQCGNQFFLNRQSKNKGKEDSVSLSSEAGSPAGDQIQSTLGQYKPMTEGQLHEEWVFWQNMTDLLIGHKVKQGLSGGSLAFRLRNLRGASLISLIILNALWLVLLSVLYFNSDLQKAQINIYGLVAATVYGLVLCIQLVGMTIHRVKATFTKAAHKILGEDCHYNVCDRKL